MTDKVGMRFSKTLMLVLLPILIPHANYNFFDCHSDMYRNEIHSLVH